jgi:sulfur-oxidizing protein SoxY
MILPRRQILISAATAPLGAIPLGAIPLGAIPLGAVPLSAAPLGAAALGTATLGMLRPAAATPNQVAALIAALAGDNPLRDGLIKLDMPLLVENGNTVAMTVKVDNPPAPVDSIHVFAEGNPLPHVATFRFGPRSGAPRIATRIRLATSQTVIAVAALRDGTFWRDSVELLVTLAACIE